MLYRFAWVLMWITFKIFFRRIDLIGLQKLKSGNPSIVIANHPASFLDAMVLAVFLKRAVHFYVRGDIFSHPLAYKILTMLHMIPIYSMEHGIHNLSKNKRTFERGRQLLEKGKLLLIFPEGFSRQSKQLEPFKKGAARVALQTAFEGVGVKNLSIQTVAINYSFHNLGSNLLIRLGDSLSIAGYEKQYQDFPAMAIGKLTKEMSSVFQKNVIHIEDGSRTDLAESLMRLVYHEQNLNHQTLFERFTGICKSINTLSPDEFICREKELVAYEHALKENNFTDKSILALTNLDSLRWFCFIYCLAPIAVFGKLVWLIPGRFSVWVANKTVTRIDFYTSVLSGVLAFIGLFWWMGLGLLAYCFFGSWSLVFTGLLPLYSYLYLDWKDKVVDHIAVRKLGKINKSQPQLHKKLLEQRNQLISFNH
jgi:1-acyl-sn-glycerol-3-phosphate acyltransferase